MPPKAKFDPKILWKTVPVHTWLTALNFLTPDSRWSLSNDKTIQGCCPVHTENTPSFYVYLDRGFAKCYGGSCQYFSNDPVKFLAKIAGTTQEQVLSTIVHKRFGYTITKKIKDDVQEEERKASLRKALGIVFNKVLCRAIDSPATSDLKYVQPLVTWLVERDIPLELVPQLPIGVMPTKTHIHDLLEPAYLDKFEKYLTDGLIGINPNEIFHFTGALSFHYNAAPRVAGRIKLRRVGEKNMIWLGTSDEPTGMFGIDLFSGNIGRDQAPGIVEGEFDVLSPYCIEIKRSSIPSTAYYGLSGSSVSDLSVLKEYGYSGAIILSDNDEGGMGFARIALEKSPKIQLHVFDWTRTPFAHHPKIDIDDIVKRGEYDLFLESLQNPECLRQRVQWVAERIATEISFVAEDDLDSQKNILTRYAPCIHDNVSRGILGDLLDEQKLMAPAIIRTLLRGAASQEEYVDSIQRALAEEIIPLHVNGFTVTCYSKIRRRTFSFNSSQPKDVITALELALKATVYDWCSSRISAPQWLALEEAGRGQQRERELLKREDLVQRLFVISMKKLSVELPHTDTLTVKQQGVHYIDASKYGWSYSPETQHRLYIVNGADLFVGYMDFEHETIRYEQLDSPIHNTLQFQLTPHPWSSCITLAALNTPLKLTPEEALKMAYEIIKLGWMFSREEDVHAMESMYLGGLPFYIPLASAFNFMTQVFLHADPQSGKSALISLFCAADSQSAISIVEHAINYGEWTASGVTQSMAGCSQMVCLDEFENPRKSDQDVARKKEVMKFLNMIRQNNVAEVKSVRGTPSGQARTQSFRAPIFAAGVNSFDQSDTNVDISRWNITRGLHTKGRAVSPEERILTEFTVDEIDDLREATTLLPLQQATKVLAAYKDVKSEFSSRTNLPPGTDFRLLNNILPVSAILKWAGQPYIDFTCDYLVYKLKMRERYYGTPIDSTLDDLMAIGRIQIPDEPGRPATAASMLADVNRRRMLNTLFTGIYYVEEHQTVVIYCRQALHQLLRFHSAYRSVDDTGLHKRLMDHPSAHTLRHMKTLRLAQHIQRFMSVRNVYYRDLVAFPIEALVELSDDDPIPKRLQ